MSLHRVAVTVLAASLLVSMFATRAAAQHDDPMIQEEARNLFEAGRTAFESGRFDAALDYFEQSYELSRRPGLLYNIGAAADRMQNNERAVEAYQAYLEAVPDTDNRPLVERRIAFLTARTPEPGEPDTATVAAAAAVDAPPPSEDGAVSGGGGDVAPWIMLGGFAAVAVVGGVLVGIARADAASVENAPMGASWADYEAAAGRALPMEIAGYVALAVGVAGATGAVLWAVLGGDAGDEDSVEVGVGPGGVAVRGSF